MRAVLQSSEFSQQSDKVQSFHSIFVHTDMLVNELIAAKPHHKCQPGVCEPWADGNNVHYRSAKVRRRVQVPKRHEQQARRLEISIRV